LNGLGANVDLSGLVNLTTLCLAKCKLTGTLTLPNVGKLVTLNLHANPGLNSIANIPGNANSLGGIRAFDCDSLDVDLSSLTSYSQFSISKWASVVIDISGRTITNSFNSAGGITIIQCPNLTQIVLPANTPNFTFSGQYLHIYSNPLLSSVVNLDKVGMTNQLFYAYGCSLNIAFPFNSNFKPNTIKIQDNGMSQANVDATINNLYSIRTEHVAGTKSLDIGGSNSAPGGIYQAPAGFVLGVDDGLPASAKEQVYVLVNNYAWAITMN
jgi:hypothetical protein